MDINQLVGKHQSIKIVPSIEDSLRNIGLLIELDENTKLWYEQLKVTWKTWKKSATVENHIEIFFYSVPDPHRVSLIFTIKCDEFKDCKPKTLPYCIIEVLSKWSEINGVLPDDSLKMPAFHIAIQQRNQHFLNLMMRVYHVVTIKETILPIVKNMIKEDNCKQASQIIIAMELFTDIPVEDLLFPLIVQDKANLIDEYLSECPSQVKPLLMFLDKLLDKNVSIQEYVQKYVAENKISHIRYDKLHYKPLGKLVARLCSKFNIPIESCKNLSKNRTTGGLRYLIHQKYQGNNVSLSVWDDLVKDSLRQNSGSALEFINMLVDYDRKEALKWAEYLKIPDIDLPLALKDLSIQDDQVKEENWDEPKNCIGSQDTTLYYKLPLSDEHIIMIDTAEQFYDMMMTNLVDSNVISIDCEWKPSFGAAQSKVALIQIATVHNIFLIDSLKLNQQQYSSFWYTFHKSLIDNAEIIKLGFGLEQDLKEMKASIVGLSNIKVKGEGLLDLSLLWRNLADCGITLPSNSEAGGNSLTCLVQSCFGLPLEKSEQCSNWELRPLRKTQIQYAALDAYVLIQIYEYLQKLCEQQGINFEEVCNDVMLEGKKKISKKNKGVEKLQSVGSNQFNSVQGIKFLVEPILSNLMPYLRYCGIDTKVMSTTMLWYDIINMAVYEERFILLSKLKYTPTVNYPQTSILDLGKRSIKEQIQKAITHFHIKVQQNDLLTRCLYCNEVNLKKLAPNEVMNFCSNYQTNSYLIDQRYGSDEEGPDYSNFLIESDEDEDFMQPVFKTSAKTNCVTSTGATIEVKNIEKISTSKKSAILCQSCGKLFWDEEELIKSVTNVIFSIIELKNNL